MPKQHDVFPSKWLTAADVETPIVVVIDDCVMETVGFGARAERKLILYFRGGAAKPHVCPKVNFQSMVALTGEPDANDWRDTTVELYAVDTTGPNGPTRGVRIRKPRTLKNLAEDDAANDVAF